MNPPRLVLLFCLSVLFGCALMTMKNDPIYSVYTLHERPLLHKTATQTLHVGGFSGLIYEGQNPKNGAHKYITVTDRGPNTDPVEIKGQEKRPFLMPEYNPEIVYFEADSKDLSLKITARLPILSPKGKPIHGLPNTTTDEDPIDVKGNPLSKDLEGLDIEGITLDPEGNFWLCEEYRPSILKVSRAGKILKRYVPKDSLSPEDLKKIKKLWGAETVEDILPAEFAKRRINRGFEGIVFHQGKLIAALQSPIKKGETEILWLEFDPIAKRSKIYKYPLSDPKVDKIGDLASDTNQVLVIEQNSETGKKSVKKIYAVSGFEKNDDNIEGKILKKKLLIDLGNLPDFDKKFDHEKLEGLALISPEMLAVLHDNDFGLSGNLTISSGIAEPKNDPSINLLQVKLAPKL